MTNVFEVITSDGSVLRYEGDEYRWQYALEEGSKDKLNKNIIEIIQTTDEEENVILCIHNPRAAGDCRLLTTIIRPREKLLRQCPRCGFTEN